MSCGVAYFTIALALLSELFYLWLRAIITFFSIWYALVHTGTKYMTLIRHVHSLYTQKSPLFRLDFFFGGSCQDIVRLNIKAEKQKFYSSTVVSFTLADLLGIQ